MVRLDRITMQGFKSFANRITIPFPAGFNSICGPNGSGKSNVIDALTFVLGTTSARTIRAQKLQNLLFNGGKSRKPAEFCEVSIYLDNNEGKIPGEKEIKITRRITRSGVSIYKLGGHTETRSKILDILSYANLSPDGYNIIMQGDVTRIIEMSPMERREIIDEISGISEFDEKKEKATRELEKVELRVRENMIVVAEKQRLVARLKQEKEAAEKYMELDKKLRKAKASLLKKKLNGVEEKMALFSARIEEGEKKFSASGKGFSEIEEEIEKKEKSLGKISDDIVKKSRNYDILRKIDSIQTEIVRKKDKIDSNEREAARILQLTAASERNMAVRQVLELGREGVHGTVSSLVKVPARYGTAMEVAIGGHSKDIVVSTDEIAVGCIKVLKQKKSGRARFLPLDRMKGREKKGYDKKHAKDVIGYAIDLIDYDKKYAPAMEYVLGSTLVVENIDIARKIKGFRVVTLEGDLAEAAGAMTGGYYIRKKLQELPDIRQLEEESTCLEGEIADLEKQLAELHGQEKEESAEVSRLQQQKEKNEKELDGLRKKRKELYEEQMVLQSAVSKDRIEKARLEAQLENLRQEFADYQDMTEFIDAPEEELQEQVRRHLIEINKLGPVNLKSVEEFGIINVEFEELTRKLNKLLEEKNAVMRVVAEIEKKRYDKFMETLTEINSNFSRIFVDIAGGSGTVRLEEENNIDSGLIIEANPSGKKILNIDSMSGGEKTITSLAFLFAIMQHYAAPFYVLDEIDAALDKANTKKILALIRKYSKEVQFIVITHNDMTIAEADKVFGVSMEEGVSRVFGIDLEKG